MGVDAIFKEKLLKRFQKEFRLAIPVEATRGKRTKIRLALGMLDFESRACDLKANKMKCATVGAR